MYDGRTSNFNFLSSTNTSETLLFSLPSLRNCILACSPRCRILKTPLPVNTATVCTYPCQLYTIARSFSCSFRGWMFQIRTCRYQFSSLCRHGVPNFDFDLIANSILTSCTKYVCANTLIFLFIGNG